MALNFPCKIYQILENESPDIVRWHSSNIAFRIIDHERFEKEIIPKYFRHNQLSSLQRQLNLYGFKCISRGDDKGAFFHPKFKRGEWETVKKITRYINPKKDSADRSCDRVSTSNAKMVKKEKSMNDSSESSSSSSTPSVYPAVSLPSSYLARKSEILYKPSTSLSSTYPKTVTTVPFKAPAVNKQSATPAPTIPTPSAPAIALTSSCVKTPSIPSTSTISQPYPATKVSYPYQTLPINVEKSKSESSEGETNKTTSSTSETLPSNSSTSIPSVSDSTPMYDIYDPFVNNHLFSNSNDNIIDHDFNIEAEMNLLYDVTSDSSTSTNVPPTSHSIPNYFYQSTPLPTQPTYYYPHSNLVGLSQNQNEVFYTSHLSYPHSTHLPYQLPQQKQTCDAACNTDITIPDHDQEIILVRKI